MSITKILLVKPRFYSQYPPLGLLKLSTYYKMKYNDAEMFLTSCNETPPWYPDKILITSLFTYAWKPVHESILLYQDIYPESEMQVGGIYATLFKKRVEQLGVKVHPGLFHQAEDLLPDYSLVPDWDASIIFSSRGCINSCQFCAVPKLEPEFIPRETIIDLLHPDFKKVILWDNNFLASPHWMNIANEIRERQLEVDFNQGIDARLVDARAAGILASLKTRLIRTAYDTVDCAEDIERGIKYLLDAGINGRKIFVYSLYNFRDKPDDLLKRLQDIVRWGVCAYPMRYQPIKGRHALKKDSFVSKHWTPEMLESIAKARRVIGYGGAFIPHEGLKNKFLKARTLDEAMKLRPKRSQ